MKRLGLAVLLLSCVPARADDDSVSAAAGLFGSVLKKAAKKATGRDISINDKNVQKVIKTGQAFRKSATSLESVKDIARVLRKLPTVDPTTPTVRPPPPPPLNYIC